MMSTTRGNSGKQIEIERTKTQFSTNDNSKSLYPSSQELQSTNETPEGIIFEHHSAKHDDLKIISTESEPSQIKAELTDALPTIELSKIVEPPKYSQLEDPAERLKQIVAEFNRGNKANYVVENPVLGTRIDAGQVMLVHRNNQPQLVPPSRDKWRLQVNVTGVTEKIGVYDQTDLMIGAHGRYVVNVPLGHYAKAWYGKGEAKLLGEGIHVIRHDNFHLDEKEPLVKVSDPIIRHGNIAIIRVDRGKLTKIKIGTTPYLLESAKEPYVFQDNTFSIVPTIDPTTKESYYFLDTNKADSVTHGSITRLMPGTGKVAVCSESGKLVTVGRSEDSDHQNNPDVFTYNLGNSDKPFIRNSETFEFKHYIQINRRTLLFPSEEAKTRRLKDDPKDPHTPYVVFNTNDGLPIGVQIFVAYEIEKPQLAIRKVPDGDLDRHIENIVVAHISSIVNSCSSSDFQRSGKNEVKDPKEMLEAEKVNQTQSTPTTKTNKNAPNIDEILQIPKSSPSPFYSHLRSDTVHVVEDLYKIGLNITQLRIEPPVILNKKIADEMANNSLLAAQARAQASAQSINSQIAIQTANQEAEQLRIQTERQRDNLILQAQGKGEAVKIEADFELQAAQMKAQASRVEQDQKLYLLQKKMELKIKTMEAKGKLYHDYPELLQAKLNKQTANALAQNMKIVSPELVASLYATPGVSLFSGNTSQQKWLEAETKNDLQKNKQAIPAPAKGPSK